MPMGSERVEWCPCVASCCVSFRRAVGMRRGCCRIGGDMPMDLVLCKVSTTNVIFVFCKNIRVGEKGGE